MPDLPISQLPETTTPNGSDVFPIVDQGTTKKLALSDLLKYISNNMNFGNFPYVKAEIVTNSDITIGVPPVTSQLQLTNIQTSLGFNTSPTINSGGVLLPAGTYNFKWITSSLFNSEYKNTHNIQWTLVNRSNSNAIISRTPEAIRYFSATEEWSEHRFEGTFKIDSPTSIGIQLLASVYTYSWNSKQGSFSFNISNTNTSAGSLEFWKVG